MIHSTNPTKPNKTAKAMLIAKCTPPSTALIPDEVPFEPPVEPVDDDVAPDAVPDAEEDVVELEVEKVAVGSPGTALQVPPIKKKVESKHFLTIWFKGKVGYLTTRRRVCFGQE